MRNSESVQFIDFDPAYQMACLTLFDLNCPKYFACNERDDYDKYLSSMPVGYELLQLDKKIIGGVGLCKLEPGIAEIHWILLEPESHGIGLGKMMMDRVVNKARSLEVSTVQIAASHLSGPFFAKFGAVVIHKIENGWGVGMHREDMVLEL